MIKALDKEDVSYAHILLKWLDFCGVTFLNYKSIIYTSGSFCTKLK